MHRFCRRWKTNLSFDYLHSEICQLFHIYRSLSVTCYPFEISNSLKLTLEFLTLGKLKKLSILKVDMNDIDELTPAIGGYVLFFSNYFLIFVVCHLLKDASQWSTGIPGNMLFCKVL